MGGVDGVRSVGAECGMMGIRGEGIYEIVEIKIYMS